MLSREDAVNLIKRQLSIEGMHEVQGNKTKPHFWHYGKVELRELMDAIYGGPPQSDSEKI